jgi:hypothetical protein
MYVCTLFKMSSTTKSAARGDHCSYGLQRAVMRPVILFRFAPSTNRLAIFIFPALTHLGLGSLLLT